MFARVTIAHEAMKQLNRGIAAFLDGLEVSSAQVKGCRAAGVLVDRSADKQIMLWDTREEAETVGEPVAHTRARLPGRTEAPSGCRSSRLGTYQGRPPPRGLPQPRRTVTLWSGSISPELWSRRMPRPKLFDRDVALQKAIGMFRQHGFAGTSTNDLRRAMGISRQSMYDTFGDKRRLYLEALRRYNAESVSRSIQVLSKAPSPRAGLEAMLADFATRAVDERANCLGVSSISEFGRSDEGVCTLNDASGQVLIAAIEKVAADAKASGEIGSDLDPKAVAQFLVSLHSGMRLSARAGVSPSDLREIVKLGLRNLS